MGLGLHRDFVPLSTLCFKTEKGEDFFVFCKQMKYFKLRMFVVIKKIFSCKNIYNYNNKIIKNIFLFNIIHKKCDKK